MSDEDKTYSGSFVLDLRIWWRQAHTLYYFYNVFPPFNFKIIARVRGSYVPWVERFSIERRKTKTKSIIYQLDKNGFKWSDNYFGFGFGFTTVWDGWVV